MDLVNILFYISTINICIAVPPSPVDRLWEEINSAKSMMSNIAVQLDKFNSLYLMKLEQRMMTLSNTLGNIDSNIKNLQERAHVWDTFQLHVSAWNEQIGTLDKKVEIISKGQEKMFMIDGKLSAIQNIEYKIERIFTKLEDTVSTLQAMNKNLENQPQDSMLTEFASRGVLSTLKIIERKLDKLQMQYASSQSLISKQLSETKKKTDSEDQKNKLLIKCNTPPVVEELLNDVSSKVDVLFDKFTGNEEQNDGMNQDEQQDSSVEQSQETRNDPDLKLIKGLLKRLNQPCKRTVKVLENLESSIKTIDNTTFTILEDGQNMHSDINTQYDSQNAKIQKIASRTQDLLIKFDEMLSSINTKHLNEQDLIVNLFKDHEAHIDHLLKDKIKVESTALENDGKIEESEDSNIEILVDEDDYLEYYPKHQAIVSNRTSCEELDMGGPSGIYIFANENIYNATERNIAVRHCDMSAGGGWTVIQNRGVNPEVQSFNLSWHKYKRGFGSLDEDFWFGNDFIHNLTTQPMILRVELENFEGVMAWAEYSDFNIASENDNYKLNIGGYRGNASDSFSTHSNSSFSTYDRKNDYAPECCPCSLSYGGGWWFYSCFEANLNGIYYKTPTTNEYFRGIIWEHWLGNYSLRRTKMMIRPKMTDVIKNSTEIYRSNDNSEEIPEDP